MAITPIYATIFVASTRWVKFLKYHVRTPHTDITIHKPYHKGEITNLITSQSYLGIAAHSIAIAQLSNLRVIHLPELVGHVPTQQMNYLLIQVD